MKNLSFFGVFIFVLIGFSCNRTNKTDNLNGTHKVEVVEVLQTSNYTYLKVKEFRNEQWIAVTKREAKVGDVYYYDNFMEMVNFESKELDRIFESVYFIQELRTTLISQEIEQHKMPEGHVPIDEMGQKPRVKKETINLEPAEGGITIAELFENKEKYNGKKIIVRGKVINANFGIMKKNWFHIQDGSSTNGGFDLTVTTLEKDIKLNDTIIFEGTVALNKDFGYGYKYEILLEDAIRK